MGMGWKALTTACALAAVLGGGHAQAQVSLDELDDAMEQSSDAMDAFRERLNDSDPDKALRAMALLIEKGDTDQRRMALRHGLYSTDTAIRATVLRAILSSQPTLTLDFTPVTEADVYYQREITGRNGSLSSDNTANVTVKLSGYDEAEECWTTKISNYDRCFARMRGEVVSVFFGGSWAPYTLNEEGALVGEHTIHKTVTNVSVDLAE